MGEGKIKTDFMKPSSAKQKGKLLEDYVADQIVAVGLDPKARRDGASGAGDREKGDVVTSMMVLGQNAGIECKNQATLCIPEWWRQTKKLESLGREPILVFKQFGEPLGESKAVVYLDTLLRLIKQAEGRPVPMSDVAPTQYDRELRWKAERAKQAIGELLKELP